ncbi:MAG: DUF4382 domain-containing protein, partial [Candidatus Aminicenantes bacterium]|nr:DUF4382 domain-containing protein [Candidatus Aminicenantes bacterium]
MKKFSCALLFFLILFGACFFNQGEKTGNFQLYLTDSPLEGLEHVYVVIGAIKVKKEDGTVVTVLRGPKVYDLLALQNREELLVDIELEAGTYTQIIVILDSASVVINGNTTQVDIVSGLEVVIHVVFTITGDTSTQVVLDFEAAQSIQVVVG